jgi:NDMA-dependent alcohol dehydrogenase
MITKGAINWKPGTRSGWTVEPIDLAPPRSHEILVKLAASGLCHSDDHVDSGVYVDMAPMLGGHEGAGVVEEVGADVKEISPGDHVVMSFLPTCGRCGPCVAGHSNLCVLGADILSGPEMHDGRPRVMNAEGVGVGTMGKLGTFSPYIVCSADAAVKIREDVPLDKAALVGCGVTTGWGSAVMTAETQVGDVVVVVGTGGVGINAVQGAVHAGARYVVAVDPVPFKREKALEFGATHVSESMEQALELVNDLTWGRLADRVILTMGEFRGHLLEPAMQLAGKRGVVVATSVAPGDQRDVQLDLFALTCYEKQLRGGLFGSCNPRNDIPRLLDLYMDGRLKLDELITKTYSLEQINEGYRDMHEGRILRGVIVFE